MPPMARAAPMGGQLQEAELGHARRQDVVQQDQGAGADHGQGAAQDGGHADGHEHPRDGYLEPLQSNGAHRGQEEHRRPGVLHHPGDGRDKAGEGDHQAVGALGYKAQDGLDYAVHQPGPVKAVADDHHPDDGYHRVGAQAPEGVLGVEQAQLGQEHHHHDGHHVHPHPTP